MVYQLTDTWKAARLFAGWQESLIWSCLDRVMGEIYVDSLNEPESALAFLGEFGYLAGKPNKELVLHKPEGYKNTFMLLVPQTKAWASLIEEAYPNHNEKVTRYAIKKEKGIFDQKHLEEMIASLPKDYSIKEIDEEIYHQCSLNEWSKYFVSNYKTYDQYQKFGIGYAVMKDQEIVAGASSYSSFQNGIEIEIDTNEAYRKQGLAKVCGAKIILESLNRGWYPSWDAANTISVHMAEEFGYHFDREYETYVIYDI